LRYFFDQVSLGHNYPSLLNTSKNKEDKRSATRSQS
jgi:hypothetical protein